MNLTSKRNQIDKIDQQIVNLLNKRLQLAKQIGDLKNGGPIEYPAREAEVLNNITIHNKIFPIKELKDIYLQIIKTCREAQIKE